MSRLACALHGLSPLSKEPGSTFAHTWPHRALLERFIDNEYALWYKGIQYVGAAAMSSHPSFDASKAATNLGKVTEGLLSSLPNLTGGVSPKRIVNADRESFVRRAKKLRKELGEADDE